MDSIMKRIVDELAQQNKKQSDLAVFIGVTANVITDWKSGRIKSYTKYIHGIAKFLNVSVEYLKGETDIKRPVDNSAQPNLKFVNGLFPDEVRLITIYRNNPEIRAKIQAFLEVNGEPLHSNSKRIIEIAAYGGGVMEHTVTATDEEIRQAIEESNDDQFVIK